MESSTISTRIGKDTLKKLEKLAAATKRSKSYLTAEAIQRYVDEQSWQIKAIKEGIKEADKGNFATDVEVNRALKKWGVDAN